MEAITSVLELLNWPPITVQHHEPNYSMLLGLIGNPVKWKATESNMLCSLNIHFHHELGADDIDILNTNNMKRFKCNLN